MFYFAYYKETSQNKKNHLTDDVLYRYGENK